ncbi:MAG: hypothetical protein L3J91_01545, partial [Thermoplasmata archaeon]|nr:hypothetical protein [Thermoplasmata archaeon]
MTGPMTLILDPSTIPESTFRAMGRELQMELEEILASVAERGAPKDPLGVVTATDLLKSAIALGKATDGAP